MGAGDDYGTISRQGWHPGLGIGFSLITNTMYSMEAKPIVPPSCASSAKHIHAKERKVCNQTGRVNCTAAGCCFDNVTTGSPPCFVGLRATPANMHVLYCKQWKVIFSVLLNDTHP